jgi:hypothetical protein
MDNREAAVDAGEGYRASDVREGEGASVVGEGERDGEAEMPAVWASSPEQV